MNSFIFNLKVLFKGIGLDSWEEHNVEHVAGQKYRALTNAPHFQIKKRFVAGWYVLESAIDTDDTSSLKLYYDTGNGYSEDDRVAMAFRDGSKKKRFFRIPKSCRALRFDPVENKAEFTVLHFKLRAVPKWFAMSRIKRKLRQADVHPAQKNRLQEYARLFEAPELIQYKQYIESIEPGLWRENLSTEAICFSVLMPVFNPNVDHLKQALDSILAQRYPHWQLCIGDDASTDVDVVRTLKEYQERDPRIRIIWSEKNGHLCEASNAALALCEGDFVALMDPDDKLSPDALNEMAWAITENPNCNILYSDEDTINPGGDRLDPHFKTDWNYRLLLSQNYVSHLGVYRRSLVEKAGGFRVGFEGGQDYDLLLRCVKVCNREGIVHIPKILYHRRVSVASAGLVSGEAGDPSEAGINALNEHLGAASGIEVRRGKFQNTYRLKMPLPKPNPLVSLIIPAHNAVEYTKRAIDSILTLTSYTNFEILLVDNNSDDKAALKYFDSLQGHPKITVLKYPHPFNYSAINNFAVKQARGEIIGLINNDIEVITPEWLSEMVSYASLPEAGCVGAKLYYPDNRIQHAGVVLGIGGVAGHCHRRYKKGEPGYFSRLYLVQNVSAVTAATLLVKRTIFDEVGGLDEKNLPIAYNDVDFCLKVRTAGYENIWTPYAELIHHESISRGYEDNPKKIRRLRKDMEFMQDKWGELLLNDPFYNRNFTLEREDMSLRRQT